jgi:5-methylcytosine-specific restriction endonuclease McrA
MSKRFYNSIVWQHARTLQLHRHPLCHDCLAEGRTTRATTVHHVAELTDAPDLALDPSNHRSLCHACHSRLHARTKVHA